MTSRHYLWESASQPVDHEGAAYFRDIAFGLACQLLAHPDRQHASRASNLASRLATGTLATRFDRLVPASLRLICTARCRVALGHVSRLNGAKGSRRGLPVVSSGVGAAGNAATDEASAAGGTIVGWLVSNSIFSGHLRSDLIRMAGIVMTCGRLAKIAGGAGQYQPTINSRAASALPTNRKYLATGTAHHSSKLPDSVSPTTAI
jgi:hypothetical protein